MFRAILLSTSLLYALPALAAIDPPAASKNDARIRLVTYDPSNPVELHIMPGMSLRLEFGPDETVPDGGIVVSDQDIMRPDQYVPPTTSAINPALFQNQGASSQQPSCDANLCRNVVKNVVYLKAVRELDAQPLFIQTERTNAFGVKEQVPYAFEVSTLRAAPEKNLQTASLEPQSKTDATAAPEADPPPKLLWGVRFVYPERVKQQQQADLKKRQDEWRERNRLSPPLAAPVVDKLTTTSNIKYGYRGSASFMPDEVWDDGRFTYFRYKGNRRVPNIYSLLPSGEPTIPASWPQPDPTGTTLKVSGTETKWYISDGSDNGKPPIGCVINAGPDPDGRTSMTIAGH